ncbi:WecB/TagA/CpsF family glycosyltransferase [Spirosoma rigui]|uniref:WecB/TagA/CpsF family glycosyltransferase n=1 Tax=Spirosoma rigui TaxID=564064 RepID=UPI0009B08D1D|nr:WecB/TagA/CpsF family glycosyltransferase [Spirosoma rigui]
MIKVLDVNLYDTGLENAVAETIRDCHTGLPRQNHCVSATGAHGLVTAVKEPNFKTVLDSFHWNLPDGMPGVWIGRWKGARQMTRCYGPDFFKLVMSQSAQQPIRHFFCGGQPGVAEELKASVGAKFGNYQVAGTFCPPFREMSDDEFRDLAQTINNAGVNIVWIGLSTPKQERFARRLAQWVNVHFIVTVGAAFDFHTDRVVQAPSWMQRLSLEWFFRLMVEPKRLYKRYLEVVPLFIYLNLKEVFSPVKQSTQV